MPKIFGFYSKSHNKTECKKLKILLVFYSLIRTFAGNKLKTRYMAILTVYKKIGDGSEFFRNLLQQEEASNKELKSLFEKLGYEL